MSDWTHEETAAAIVDEILGSRLDGARAQAGLRAAVTRRLVDRVDEIRDRGRAQIEHMRTGRSDSIPDALFSDEEIAEDELQEVMAGLRAAQAMTGSLSDDPLAFDRNLAQLFTSTSRWARRAEASRVPRPATRPDGLTWTSSPIPWIEDADAWPPPGAAAVADRRLLDEMPGREGEPPYEGWIQIALVERQRTFADRHRDAPARQVFINLGMQVSDGPLPAGTSPLSLAPPHAWSHGHHRLVLESPPKRGEVSPGPLAAVIDYSTTAGSPALDRGPGLLLCPLVPTRTLVAMLGLRPESPVLRHVLVDDDGVALVGRLWHGFLVRNGVMGSLEPAVHGADLILRPDLFDVLERSVGRERLGLGVSVICLEDEAN